MKLYYGYREYVLKDVAELQKAKSGKATCRLCCKKIKKGGVRFYAVRGNLDRRMYHWRCGLQDGFTLHHSSAKEFPSVSKAFRTKKNKGPVKKGKKRSNKDTGKRKRKRKKTSSARKIWTTIMKNEDINEINKLNLEELLALCLFNNIEIWGVNKEKVTIVRSKAECIAQLQQIAKAGWRDLCPCGGRWDYQTENHWRNLSTENGVRCMGNWENSYWSECTQGYERDEEITTSYFGEKMLKVEPYTSAEKMPKSRSKKIAFPNPYLCDEVMLVREIFSSEICIEGETFDINEELTEEIVSFLTPFPQYFLEVVQGKFGKAAMPGTSMLTIGGFKKILKNKQQKKRKRVKNEDTKKRKKAKK